MSRSDYSDDYDSWSLIRWRGQVASSIRGKRGQAMLKELAEALDTMPVKRLIANKLEADGEYCALGVLGAKRGLDLKNLDPELPDAVAAAFNIAEPLAREIVYMNDEQGAWLNEITPEERWKQMREWVGKQLRVPAAPEGTEK